VSVDYNDEKLGWIDRLPGVSDPDGSWDVVNNTSRLGVMGSEDLGGGLSAIYQYEFGVDVTEGGNFDGNRPKFVGLKGGFGQISLGTQDTPYYNVAGIVDIFNTDKSFGAVAWLGGSFNGFGVNLSPSQATGEGALLRLENSLYYTTPEFSGFSGEAMLVMNGAENNSQGYSDGIDLWNIALKYNNGPFFAGVSYIQLDGNKVVDDDLVLGTDLDMDQWVAGLGYTAGPFGVGLIYERGTLNAFGLLRDFTVDGVRVFPGSDDAQNWYLTGEYAFGNNTLRAAYGQLDTGIDDRDAQGVDFDDKIDNYLVGYQYNFSKRTSVWIEYIGRSADTLLYGDANAVSIGTRVDF
jgi:predicted porin